MVGEVEYQGQNPGFSDAVIYLNWGFKKVAENTESHHGLKLAYDGLLK